MASSDCAYRNARASATFAIAMPLMPILIGPRAAPPKPTKRESARKEAAARKAAAGHRERAALHTKASLPERDAEERACLERMAKAHLEAAERHDVEAGAHAQAAAAARR